MIHLVLLLAFGSVESVRLVVYQDGPAVLGSTVTLRAQLYDENGRIPSGRHQFIWSDNANPTHSFTEEGFFSASMWNVTYPSPTYYPGVYIVEVKVSNAYPLWHWHIASARVSVNVTAFLNGQIDIVQNRTVIGDDDVSTTQTVVHKVNLGVPETNLLSGNDTVITTHWFVGCTYYGATPDLTFSFNYTKPDVAVFTRALVIAGKSSNNSIDDNRLLSVAGNVTEAPDSSNWTDKDCDDFPSVPRDPNKYYGYFRRQIIPRNPVQVGNVSGNEWLKNGELLHLNFTCSGSGPFYHCVKFIAGIYHVTGNETCGQSRQTQNCKIAVTRLLSFGSKYTILFIVSNKVSKTVTPVAVTTYSLKPHPQLSVIVVPVSCSVLAVFIIIFGVAYYIQSRNSYKIEVADFDFTKASDTEYKTFRERLREAVSSAFTRVREEDYSEEGPAQYSSGGGSGTGVWSPTRKNRPPRDGLLYENSDSDNIDN